MAEFKQTVTVPVGGVSQLPPESRGPGYADDMVNSFPSSVRGLGVRQPTVPLAAGLGSLDAASVHLAEIEPSNDEKYLAVFDKNGVRVVDTKTGTLRTVTLDPAAAAFLANGGFSSVALGDNLYVARKGSRAVLTGAPVPTPQAGALVTVESGRPSALYRITLDGINIDVRTPDDPPPQVKRPAIGLTVTTGDPPQMEMSVFPSGTTLEPSHSSTHNVSFSRTGYLGTITLAITEVTTGISASLSLTSLPSGTDISVLTINVASGTAPGSYSVKLKATGVDVPDVSTEVAVIVVAAGSIGGTGGTGGPTGTTGMFTVTPSSGSVSVAAGSSVNFDWSISRSSGYTGDITVATVGPPALLGVTRSPTSLVAPATIITSTFSPDPAMSPGGYTFPLRFVGAGSADVTRNITVTVNPAVTEFRWNPSNQNDIFASVGETGSIPLYIERIGSFSEDLSVGFDGWNGPITAVDFSTAFLGYGGADHTNLNYDFSGTTAGTYTAVVRLSTTSGAAQYATIIFHVS